MAASNKRLQGVAGATVLALILIGSSSLAVHAGGADRDVTRPKQIAWLDGRLPELRQSGSQAGAAAPAPRAVTPIGDLNQVMRSIFFPNANIIFNVQLEDPGEAKAPADKDGGSKFSITAWGDNLYTKWEIVSYAAVALEESAYLLTKPDRQCQNGKPAPITQAEWIKYSTELADTAKAVYAAAQAKNRDTVVELTDRLNDACASCHNAYRRGADATRCTPRP